MTPPATAVPSNEVRQAPTVGGDGATIAALQDEWVNRVVTSKLATAATQYQNSSFSTALAS